MELIKGPCPCGQPLAAVIFADDTVRFYVDDDDDLLRFELDGTEGPARFCMESGGQQKQQITRCPVCDRDFSGITTGTQLKELAWPT